MAYIDPDDYWKCVQWWRDILATADESLAVTPFRTEPDALDAEIVLEDVLDAEFLDA